jgi:hypothetical protein
MSVRFPHSRRLTRFRDILHVVGMSGDKLRPLATVLCRQSDKDRGKTEDTRTVERDVRRRHRRVKPCGRRDIVC